MKKTVVILFVVVTLAALWAFTPRPGQTDAHRYIREEFIKNLFETRYASSNPNAYDTSLKALDQFDRRTYAANQCYGSNSPIRYTAQIIYSHWDARNILDPNLVFANNADYDSSFNAVFKQTHGLDLIAKKVDMAQKSGSDYRYQFKFYNPKGLRAAFDNIYRKPTDNWQKMSYQKIYNATMKSYMRESGIMISRILSNRALFNRIAAEYLSLAKTDSLFEGIDFCEKAAERIFNDTGGSHNELIAVKCIHPGMRSRFVGLMLRRQVDGSLPVLLEMFKTILKDYDPEYYNRLAPQLK